MSTPVNNEQPVFLEKTSGSRKWFNGMPSNVPSPDYIVRMWDFIDNADGLDTTNDWVVVKDAGASVAVVADQDGGVIRLTSTATTDNDGASIQTAQEVVSMNGAKQCWIEARIQKSAAADQDMWFGVSDAFATNPEAVLTDPDRAGFQIDDGNASLLCKAESGGLESSFDSGKDAVNATYVLLGMHYDGNRINYYVDREYVGMNDSNLPNDQQLCIGFMALSGSTTGTMTAQADYVWLCQER